MTSFCHIGQVFVRRYWRPRSLLGEGGRECSPAGCKVESRSHRSKFPLFPPSLLFSFLHFLRLFTNPPLFPSLYSPSLDSIPALTNQMIGHKLKTKQTTGNGVLVKKVKTITSLHQKMLLSLSSISFVPFSTFFLPLFPSLPRVHSYMHVHVHHPYTPYTHTPFTPPLHTHTHTHNPHIGNGGRISGHSSWDLLCDCSGSFLSRTCPGRQPRRRCGHWGSSRENTRKNFQGRKNAHSKSTRHCCIVLASDSGFFCPRFV